MRIAVKILNRVIGVQFYQRHAGMFLFIFILMFGVVHGQELWLYHLSLIYAMLGSPLFLSIVFLVWLLYTLKCVQFTMKILSEPSQQFTYILAALEQRSQWLSLLAVQIFMYLPVLLYVLLVIGVAVYIGAYAQGLLIVGCNLLLCILAAFLYKRKIAHPDPAKAFFLSRIFKFRIKKPFTLFFISCLLNEMKVIFLVSKFFSIILILAFLNGFFIETYDSRVVMLGFLLGLTAHCVIVFEFRKFEEYYLGFYRNLPLRMITRFTRFVFIYAMILLPEWIVFVTAIPVKLHPPDFLFLPFFGIALLLFYHCLLYRLSMDMERYLLWVFITMLAIFFLILYRQYVVIDGILLLSSLLFFTRNYFNYERVEGS